MAPRYRTPLGDRYLFLRSGIQPRSINSNTNTTTTNTTATGATGAATGAGSTVYSILPPSPPSPASLTPKDPTSSPSTHPIPLAKRYQTISIPSTYTGLNTSPAPGTVAGIVIGSVAGFIILLYLLSLGVNGNNDSGVVVDEERDSGGRLGFSGSRRRRRHGGRPAVTEVIRTVRPRDRRRRHHGHGHAHAGRRGHRDTILVDESITSPSRTDDGGDVVEVFEENSSVNGGGHHGRRPRSHSRRRARSRGSYRSVERY